MNGDPSEFPIRLDGVRTTPALAPLLRAAGLGSVAALSERALGTPVTDARSSWVRRLRIGTIDCYVKTYDYPTRRDRWRGGLRTTWLAPSRAAREVRALRWLRAHGFDAPQALALGEERRLGILCRAVLVTERWPGRPLDRWLGELPAAERTELLEALAGLVRELHRQGFRDRNLDLRNLLGRRAEDGYRIAKLDSPRYRLVRPGDRDDRLRRADLARLGRSLAALGLDLPPAIRSR